MGVTSRGRNVPPHRTEEVARTVFLRRSDHEFEAPLAYCKGRAPWWKASPKTATAWNGHFADPDNKTLEVEIATRLKKEFEDPVNDFLESIGPPPFQLRPTHIPLLTGYMRM